MKICGIRLLSPEPSSTARRCACIIICCLSIGDVNTGRGSINTGHEEISYPLIDMPLCMTKIRHLRDLFRKEH